MRPGVRTVPGFVACVFGLSAILVTIRWWTGEPPKWRWGGDERHTNRR